MRKGGDWRVKASRLSPEESMAIGANRDKSGAEVYLSLVTALRYLLLPVRGWCRIGIDTTQDAQLMLYGVCPPVVEYRAILMLTTPY